MNVELVHNSTPLEYNCSSEAWGKYTPGDTTIQSGRANTTTTTAQSKLQTTTIFLFVLKY
jgi:hypothetical protein